MRLRTICNGSKQTISASNRLELLQMESVPDTGPSREVDYEIPHQLALWNLNTTPDSFGILLRHDHVTSLS